MYVTREVWQLLYVKRWPQDCLSVGRNMLPYKCEVYWTVHHCDR